MEPPQLRKSTLMESPQLRLTMDMEPPKPQLNPTDPQRPHLYLTEDPFQCHCRSMSNLDPSLFPRDPHPRNQHIGPHPREGHPHPRDQHTGPHPHPRRDHPHQSHLTSHPHHHPSKWLNTPRQPNLSTVPHPANPHQSAPMRLGLNPRVICPRSLAWM